MTWPYFNKYSFNEFCIYIPKTKKQWKSVCTQHTVYTQIFGQRVSFTPRGKRGSHCKAAGINNIISEIWLETLQSHWIGGVVYI